MRLDQLSCTVYLVGIFPAAVIVQSYNRHATDEMRFPPAGCLLLVLLWPVVLLACLL
jgi:hypothetical protein